jgi:hypothetical protein
VGSSGIAEKHHSRGNLLQEEGEEVGVAFEEVEEQIEGLLCKREGTLVQLGLRQLSVAAKKNRPSFQLWCTFMNMLRSFLGTCWQS